MRPQQFRSVTSTDISQPSHPKHKLPPLFYPCGIICDHVAFSLPVAVRNDIRQKRKNHYEPYVTICGTQLHAVWFSHLPQIGGTQLHAVWFSHSLPQTATSYGACVNMTSCSTHLHAANALFVHYALVVNLDTDDLPSAKPLCCSCLCFSILFSLSTGQ